MESTLAHEWPVWFVRALSFAFGAIWGSFANVVIYRWPREMSVVRPGSRCGACGHPVRPWDNVPILSWFVLRGRCRDCHTRISFRYPMVETIFAVISMAIAERLFVRGPATLGAGVALAHDLVRFAVAFVLLVAAFIDLDEMLVPWFVKYTAVIPLAAAAFLPRVDPSPGLLGALAGAGVGYLGLRILFIDGYQFLTGRKGMGLGDAEILLLVGATLGVPGVLFSLGAGAVQGVLATGIAMLAGTRIGPADADLVEDTDDAEEPTDGEAADASHEAAVARGEPDAPIAQPRDASGKPRMKVPFVPFLALAALEYMLGADALVDAYLRFMRGD